MARLDTSKAAELRMLAEKLRRGASEMTLLNYVRLMQRAARDLEAEADFLERTASKPLGQHIDIVA